MEHYLLIIPIILLGDNNTFKNNVAHERGGSVYAEINWI